MPFSICLMLVCSSVLKISGKVSKLAKVANYVSLGFRLMTELSDTKPTLN
jgi:hypothetical protein